MRSILMMVFLAPFKHEPELRLLAWSWVMIACMLPEMIAGYVIALPQLKSFREGPYYRHVQAGGTAMALCVLVLANIIGFSSGVEGGQSLSSPLAFAFFFSFTYCLAHFNNLIK